MPIVVAGVASRPLIGRPTLRSGFAFLYFLRADRNNLNYFGAVSFRNAGLSTLVYEKGAQTIQIHPRRRA